MYELSRNAAAARPILPARADWAGDYEGAFVHDDAKRATFEQQLAAVTGVTAKLPIDRTGNTPTPELSEVARAMLEHLENDPVIAARIEGNLALKALHTQTVNHLRHATFEFAHDGDDYPHADVLASPCPFRPTLKALLKALDFERFLFSPPVAVDNQPVNAEAEKGFKDAEQKIVRAMTIDNPQDRYSDMQDRLVPGGRTRRLPSTTAPSAISSRSSRATRMSSQRLGSSPRCRASAPPF